uniref:Uncharacterized protein n=1 Tax=Rhizophora mucronata TaxID=61149 RepID=A0A2P2PV15_RHIMU
MFLASLKDAQGLPNRTRVASIEHLNSLRMLNQEMK